MNYAIIERHKPCSPRAGEIVLISVHDYESQMHKAAHAWVDKNIMCHTAAHCALSRTAPLSSRD